MHCRWILYYLSHQEIPGEELRAITNSSRKNEVAGTKQKWHSGVVVSGGESKVWFCKEKYCIGTWNVRSLNQGKWHMVKQEMARLNTDILGISELLIKWTRMGKFNSHDHYIYNCGQECFRRNGEALSQLKSLKCSIWVQLQKLQNDLSSFSRQTSQHLSNPSLCSHHWHLKS